MNSLSTLLDMASEIERHLIDNDGLITPELEALMTNLDISLPAKIDSYAYVIEQLEVQQEWYDTQIKELQRNKKARVLAGENIIARLKDLMLQNKLTDLVGDRKRFKLQASNPKMIVRDEKQIPATYLIEETRIYPDNEKIKTDLKSGIPVPGCELEQSWALMKRAKK